MYAGLIIHESYILACIAAQCLRAYTFMYTFASVDTGMVVMGLYDYPTQLIHMCMPMCTIYMCTIYMCVCMHTHTKYVYIHVYELPRIIIYEPMTIMHVSTCLYGVMGLYDYLTQLIHMCIYM